MYTDYITNERVNARDNITFKQGNNGKIYKNIWELTQLNNYGQTQSM